MEPEEELEAELEEELDGRHRKLRGDYAGIAGKQNTDVTWLVNPTRIVYRILGVLGIAFAFLLYSEPDTSIFDFILPIAGICLGFQGLVLRAEIADSGTLLKIHSLIAPQRIALEPGMKITVVSSDPWWSKGISIPGIMIENSEGKFHVPYSQSTPNILSGRVEALYDLAEMESPQA